MLNENQILIIESKINYHFKNKKLLQQAFTRKSYATAFGCEDNEVLEFFGDRVLNYAVMKDMYDRFGRINNQNEFFSDKSVGDLSEIDTELVRNSNLAGQVNLMELQNHMQVIHKSESKSLKNKADLFEAILGAVAIDSSWDISTIFNVYRSMLGSYEKTKVILNSYKNNYKDTFETLIWRYQICKTKNNIIKDGEIIICKFVMIIAGTACEIEGHGKKRNEAISAAYEIASKLVYLVLEKTIIKDDTYSKQLYLLFKYGFISEPQFHFEYFPKNSNNLQELWRCFISFPESENEFMTEDIYMTDAREQACHFMLCEVLGIDYEKTETEDSEINQNYAAATSKTIIRGQGLLKYILSMYKNVA